MAINTVPPAGLDTTAQYYSFKNRIINGAMVIDQRNAGAAVTNSTGVIYTLDRWMNQTVGSNCVIQQVTGSTGNNKAIRATGASGNATTLLSQRIEAVNISDLAGQTVTVSFKLYGSGSGAVSVRFVYPTATDNYTGTTEPVGGTTVNFTTTATTYTVTRTLDANANKGVWILFDRGATGAGVTWTLEDVQLEKGSTATSFDYRPYGTELALCQRYLPAVIAESTLDSLTSAVITSTVTAYLTLKHPVTARTRPTGVTASATSIITVSGAAVTSAIGFNNAGTEYTTLVLTSSGLTTGVSAATFLNTAGAKLLLTGCEL